MSMVQKVIVVPVLVSSELQAMSFGFELMFRGIPGVRACKCDRWCRSIQEVNELIRRG